MLKIVERLIVLNQISKPFRNLILSRLIWISMIHQYDGAEVLNMPNHSPDSLVDCSSCLLTIPLRPCQTYLWPQVLLLEIIFLQDHNWISHLRIRNSHQDDAASCSIREIKSFRDSASANSHQNGPRFFVLEDGFVVLLNHTLILLRVLWLLKYFLIFANKF